VGLVDDHQSSVLRQRRQHLVAKVGVVQPFRADQQHVEITTADPVVDLGPVGDVARVDGGRVHPGPLGGGDLVAHERQQRGHDDGRAVSTGAQQLGGDEVHRRLAPAGALYDQRPAPVYDEGLDGGPLVVAQRGVRTGQLLEDGLGLLARGLHAPIVLLWSDGLPRQAAP
jgi:hypothetical protein